MDAASLSAGRCRRALSLPLSARSGELFCPSSSVHRPPVGNIGSRSAQACARSDERPSECVPSTHRTDEPLEHRRIAARARACIGIRRVFEATRDSAGFSRRKALDSASSGQLQVPRHRLQQRAHVKEKPRRPCSTFRRYLDREASARPGMAGARQAGLITMGEAADVKREGLSAFCGAPHSLARRRETAGVRSPERAGPRAARRRCEARTITHATLLPGSAAVRQVNVILLTQPAQPHLFRLAPTLGASTPISRWSTNSRPHRGRPVDRPVGAQSP